MNGRPIVLEFADAGRLYMYYPAIPDHQEFDSKFDYRGLNQSVIADELNPDGSPADVFWNTKTGECLTGYMAVCLPVSQVRQVSYPDTRVTRRDPVTKREVDPYPEDYVTFDVVHDPDPCMYPHCEIRPMKGDIPEEKFSKGMINIARERFAEIANRFRSECVRC